MMIWRTLAVVFKKHQKAGGAISCALCQCWCHPVCGSLPAVMFKVLSESEIPLECLLCVLLKFSKEDQVQL